MNEHQIEQDLIIKLQDLKYTYRSDIHDFTALRQNFREKFETLNRVHLTDSEFPRLMEQIVTPDVFMAARTLRERNSFERDDGTPLFYTLVNIKDWCKNTFEVVNQLRITTDTSHHRYDVILLINGVPVVQIELKTLAISPRKAMQQIVDYKNDPGNGYAKTLLCFLQLFIVSNRSDTWYFANNNSRHFSFDADERFLPLYQFATEDNKKITHLDSFAESVLAKCTLGEMISRYMVLVVSEQKLMMMRPYQMYAVKAIVACIHQNCGNGYIWHTTGSGKTLTSFKASTLLKDNPDIEKCLFVVDRKDLDRQTREEFNRFQAGCVEENTNTAALVRRLLSDDYADKVIVTTIQKLGLALDDGNQRNFKTRLEALRHKRMVFIFDECHRSQFGENHKAIKEFFPNAQLFGFTGTPIFEQNATYQQIEGQQASYKTTEDIFQSQLHAYTITHAIEDRNVLRFHIDYYKPDGTNKPRAGEALAKQAIIEAILEKHDTATAGRKFNAILATASINDAIAYYDLFKTIQANKQAADSTFRPLHIACVFSPPAEGNKDVQQIQEDLPQEKADNEHAPDEKKAALKAIIADYNDHYGANHSINEFDLYYQDVQKRIKDQQYPNRDLPHAQKIDLVIVVDMLLTGFDSKYLNTLYVDKNLKYHGLIQAFSRTNRVLNDTKPYGNILDFRQQQDAVNDAIALFSGEQTDRAKEIWLVDPAPVVITTLAAAVEKLDQFMQSQGLAYAPEEVPNLKGDAARGQFINLFKEVQRLKTQLDQYTDLTEEDAATIERVIPQEQLQAFRGVYLETAQRLKTQQDKGDSSPEVQQLDFEFVLFASAIVDYDYIMTLIARYTEATPGKQKLSRDQLIGLIESDAKFLDEREDISTYINTLKPGEALSEKAIRTGYEAFKAEQNVRQLAEIATRHGLESAALQTFVNGILQRMIFDGEQLSDLLAPLGLGWKARTQKELALMDDLIPLLHKLAQGREISDWARMSNKPGATDMNQENKPDLKPKLRFPEFQDAPEWEKKRLDNIASFYKGKGISKADIDAQGETPCIRYGELYTIYGEVIKTVFSKTKLPVTELFLSQENDVLIPSSGETKLDIAKASCILLDDVALGGDLNILRSNENGIFLSYLLNGPYKREIAKKAQGDTVVHLYANQLKLLEVVIPSEIEQQKIANCLDSIDELIATQNQKLDALKTHKKGLLQQLFPAEGETLPRLRFPEFWDAPEWEVKQFGEVCTFVRGPFGGSLKKDIFIKDGYAVYEQSHAIYQNFDSFRYYISKEKFSELKRFSVQPDDIIMSCSGTMGKFAIIPQGAKKGVINQALLKLTAKKDLNVRFIKATLELQTNQEKLLSQSAGGAIKNVVSVDQIKEIDLLFPSLSEQQKITDCLSSIDELIAAQSQKLDALKTHKKGLLQQLFPSADEVRG